MDIQVASAVGSVPVDHDIQTWIEDAVNEVGCDRDREVSVRIVDEVESKVLNHQYRAIDKATNVLSFPADDDAPGFLPPEEPVALGDIVICGPIVEREAAQQRKTKADHWAHLLVHGTLHLLGYDHEVDAEALEMEAIEIRILGRRGVGDPYAG